MTAEVFRYNISTSRQRYRRPLFAVEDEMKAGASFHRFTFSFPRMASPLVVLVVCWCLLCLCWLLSSDKTSESTNDSMSEVAKTATIVTMSAAIVQKKRLDRAMD